MATKKLALCIFILLCSITAQAEVKLGSFFIPGYVNVDRSGLFVELNHYIFPHLGLDYSLNLKPVQHAKIAFLTGDSDLLFPELAESSANYLEPEEYVSSEASRLEQLHNKPVGAVRGYT